MAGEQATHPEVLQDVVLRLVPTAGEPREVRAKVLDVEPGPDGGTVLVVARPAEIDPREHHLDVLLAWTYPLGRMECPVTVHPAHREYGDVWAVVPSAPPTRLQQRQFFRATVSVPVELSWWDDAAEPEPADPLREPPPGPRRATGFVVDLSEGGLLTSVRGDTPEPGTTVIATMALEGDAVTTQATVVRGVVFAGGGSGVALRFTDPDLHGNRVRRVVFHAERIRAQRTGTASR